MKSLILTLSTMILATSAHAVGGSQQQSEFNEAAGVRCQMDYYKSGPIESYRSRAEGVIGANHKPIESTARVMDKSGSVTPDAATYLSGELVSPKGKDAYYKISVLDSKKNEVNSFTFPEKSGMKVTIPSEAIEDESEDPTQFDTLEITCQFQSFAG